MNLTNGGYITAVKSQYGSDGNAIHSTTQIAIILWIHSKLKSEVVCENIQKNRFIPEAIIL